ncbi:MAG: N-acetyl-gamma-glutamyl-phosphate reductase, partial [Deferribacterota bacterium]|nr:N-acetyl-gamma-glutamyl-phosphate reductase [Deferribacterota bacterium]
MEIAVVGATGYTGVELVKYLSNHPHFHIKKIFSSSQFGVRLADLEPSLDGICNLTLEALNSENLLKDSSVSAFFLCQPHGTSFELVKKLVEAGKIVVDLSADFRFSNSRLYEKTYNVTHPYPELLEKKAYGIPEIFKSDIVSSNLIANPGCYPTSIIIPLYPLIEKKLVELDNIIV